MDFGHIHAVFEEFLEKHCIFVGAKGASLWTLLGDFEQFLLVESLCYRVEKAPLTTSKEACKNVQKKFKNLLTPDLQFAILPSHTVNTNYIMRTKVLLGAVGLAAGLATSAMAQSNVYSLNVVGYYNIPVAAGQKLMIANQLNTTNNTLGALIPNGPANANFFKYNGGFVGYSYDDLSLAWSPDGNATLNPGEGGFYVSPTATTLTFVGEVLQGSLTNTLPVGSKVMRSSIVPQQGLVSTDLGLPGEDNDNLFTYSGGYTGYSYDGLGAAWGPTEPTISVGQAFFYVKAPGGTQSKWIRNFTVQ